MGLNLSPLIHYLGATTNGATKPHLVSEANGCCGLLLNPLTPRSDQHATSLWDIRTLSNKQVMRILKLIR